jgi:hypothetical protein
MGNLEQEEHFFETHNFSVILQKKKWKKWSTNHNWIYSNFIACYKFRLSLKAIIIQTIKFVLFQIAEFSALQKSQLYEQKLDKTKNYVFRY